MDNDMLFNATLTGRSLARLAGKSTPLALGV